MRLTEEEKEKLFSLLDFATDGFPEENSDYMLSEPCQSVLYTLFLKFRLELRGF